MTVKMKAILVLIFFCWCFETFSQVPRVIPYKNYEKYYTVDSHIFFALKTGKKKLFYDSRPIDSTGLSLTFITCQGKNLLCFSFNRETGTKSLYLIHNAGKIRKIHSYPDIMVHKSSTHLFQVDLKYDEKKEKEKFDKGLIDKSEYTGRMLYRYGRKFILMDSLANSNNEFNIDIVSKLDSTSADQICSIFDLPNNSILVSTCFCEGGCEFFRYFKIDLSSKEIKEVYVENKEPENTLYAVEFIQNDGNYLLGMIDESSVQNKNNSGYFIFDLSFRQVMPVLGRKFSIIGENYEKGKSISINVNSVLDDNTDVIISYKFLMHLERSFYRVYKNQDLLNDDVGKLTKMELGILKNFISAKYNLRFTDNFYQSYFNLFDFYGDKKKKSSRLTTVNNLFTTTDKKNLQIIDIALSKSKK